MHLPWKSWIMADINGAGPWMIPGLAWQLNAFQVLWRLLFLLLNHHLCFYYPQSLTVWLGETTCGHRPGNVEQTRKCLPFPLKVIAITKHQRQAVLNQILLSIMFMGYWMLYWRNCWILVFRRVLLNSYNSFAVKMMLGSLDVYSFHASLEVVLRKCFPTPVIGTHFWGCFRGLPI